MNILDLLNFKLFTYRMEFGFNIELHAVGNPRTALEYCSFKFYVLIL